jgi:hypothetical protein
MHLLVPYVLLVCYGVEGQLEAQEGFGVHAKSALFNDPVFDLDIFVRVATPL